MLYRRNEDKWPVRETPAYNAVLDVVFVNTGAESVSLAEAKAHLAITYNDSDALIGNFITASRDTIEKAAGISLIARTVTARLNNSKGGIELPYGPVGDIASVKDSEGVALADTDYTIEGLAYKTLKLPEYDDITVSYAAGFLEVPYSLKYAVLLEIEAMMRLREGEPDKAKELSEQARKKAQPYSRKLWLL